MMKSARALFLLFSLSPILLFTVYVPPFQGLKPTILKYMDVPCGPYPRRGSTNNSPGSRSTLKNMKMRRGENERVRKFSVALLTPFGVCSTIRLFDTSTLMIDDFVNGSPFLAAQRAQKTASRLHLACGEIPLEDRVTRF
jgi:hypothetical protein